MKHGVLILSLITCMITVVIDIDASFAATNKKSTYFTLGPVIGFSFTKTPGQKDQNSDHDSNATHYNKIGQAPFFGFIGNVFFRMSQERIIGLQCCFSNNKLKDFYVSQPTSIVNNEDNEDSAVEVAEEYSGTADFTDGSQEGNDFGELIKNGKISYLDLMVVFKYNFTWTRTEISFAGGISKCNFTPSNKKMDTNLGYVLNAAIEYNYNKNTIFLTSLRLRHHSKKETFEPKKDSSINSLNFETGLLFSF